MKAGADPYLLCFQRQLDEDLLQLFIDEVNAELLKAIFLYEKEERLSMSISLQTHNSLRQKRVPCVEVSV